MKKLLVLILSVFYISVSYAQNQVKGTVINAETNKPLANANIMVKGAATTFTNENGEFTISCNEGLEITVSYIGFVTYSQKVACNEDLNIKLMAAANSLNEVEITATSSANKEVLYQPISIAKLSSIEIKRGNGLLLDDAINTNIAGVFMQRRTFSAGQQFNIRGYGNGARGTNGTNSNFDTQGTKVYLNGIPITDAEGITLMDDIDFGSIGNVEVVKGPAGSLYGLAIAGVVNLKTLVPPANQTSIGQEVILGSYGLKRFTTSLQIGREKSSLLVNYGKQSYDGFMGHTASDKDFLNVFGSVNPNKKQAINYYIGMSNSYDERNGELTKEQYDKFDYSGNPAYLKNNAHSAVKTLRAGISHSYNFTDNIANNTSVFGTGLVSDVSSAGGWTDKTSMNYGLRSTFDTKFQLGSQVQLSGITGVEMQAQTAQIAAYPMIVDNFNPTGYNRIGTIRSSQYTTSKTLSAFSEWTVSLPADFSVTAGLGYSTMSLELNDRLYVAANNDPTKPRIPTQISATYDGMVSPHFAVNKVFSKQVSAYASYRQGYKAPVSSYFYIPLTGQLVTGLKPELGTQYEIGTKGNLLKERLNFQVALFYAEFSNKMTTVAVPNAANTATSYVYIVNGGTQLHTGLEIALRGIVYQSAGFLKNVSLFGNFTYSDFKYGNNFKFQQLSTDRKAATEVDFSNKVVVGVPPVVYNLGVDFGTKVGLYGNMTYSQRDPMYYTSDNLNQTGTNKLLNAKIGFQKLIANRLNFDFYAAANNITGNQNYAMVFSNQLPDAYLPAPKEINYFGGLSVKYIFR